jgi:hypothetical protein
MDHRNLQIPADDAPASAGEKVAPRVLRPAVEKTSKTLAVFRSQTTISGEAAPTSLRPSAEKAT